MRTQKRKQRPSKDPLAIFRKRFRRYCRSTAVEPTAVTLATVDKHTRAQARVVLLKEVDERGFVFFTNYHSAKGRALAKHQQAALVFFWPELRQQIRVSGQVEKVSKAESDAYFASRPRVSQIGAWASQQSEPLTDRRTLQLRVAAVRKQFRGRVIPRPAHWGGFRLLPESIEFWTERPFRLHDRTLFQRARQSKRWTESKLWP